MSEGVINVFVLLTEELNYRAVSILYTNTIVSELAVDAEFPQGKRDKGNCTSDTKIRNVPSCAYINRGL